jgi:peroxiredoxin
VILIPTSLQCARDHEPTRSAAEAYSEVKMQLLEPLEVVDKVALLENFVDAYPDCPETVQALNSLAWNLRFNLDDSARARAVLEDSLERIEDPEIRFGVSLILYDVSTEVGTAVDLREIAGSLAEHRPLRYVENLNLVELAAAAANWELVFDLASAMEEQSTAGAFRADYPDDEISDELVEASVGRRRARALTYSGGALMHLGRFAEASPVFERAASLTSVNCAGLQDSPLYRFWAQYELEQGNFERAAVLAAPEAIMGENESAREILKAAYLALGGTEDGFGDYCRELRERIAKPLEDFTLLDYSGKPVSLSDMRGKVVLISIWNPACGPCRVELPALQGLWEEYRDDGFEVIAIESYAETAKAEKIVADLGLTFTCLENGTGDDELVWNQFGVSAYPTSLLIDREGRLMYYHLGYQTGDEQRTETELLTLL